MEAPARLVALMFSDVVGSTALAQRVGDEHFHALIEAHEREVREAVGRHGGTVVKSMGDGFMVTFGSPMAATRCALDLQAARDSDPAALRIRIGVHVGEARVRNGDYFGHDVNLAARIAAAAHAGEVLASAAVRAFVEPQGLGFRSTRLVSLAGINGLQEVHTASSERHAALPPSRERSLLERSQELQTLSAAAAEAMRGRGGTVILRGPAGIGKTSLLAESTARMRDAGLAVAAARASEVEQDLSYGVLRRLLRKTLRSLPDEERERALTGPARLAGVALGLTEAHELDLRLDAVGAAFAWLAADLAERSPLVLLVDDLQWADAASRHALAAIAAEADELPLLVLLALRPDEDVELELDPVLRDLRTRRLDLMPLSPAAAADLTREALAAEPDPAFVDALVRTTGGVPLLLGECLQEIRARAGAPTAAAADELREAAPEAVQRMVLLRLARLSPPAQDLARAVAVLGDQVDLRTAAALVGLEVTEAADLADALGDAGILGSGRPLEFRHPVLRTAVYRDISAGGRGRLHLRAAHLLARDGGDLEAVAAHLLPVEPAGDATVVARLCAAADHARQLGAASSAARYLERALAEPPAPDAAGAVLHALGLARLHLAHPEAVATLEQASARLTDPRERARAEMDLGRALAMGGQIEKGVARADAAIDLMSALDPDVALRWHSEVLWIEWQAEALGPAHLDRIARTPRDLPGETIGEQLTLSYLCAFAAMQGEPREQVEELARRAMIGNRVPALGLEGGPPTSFVAGAIATFDRVDEAIEMLRVNLQACEREGAVTAMPMIHSQLSLCALILGRLGEAEDAARTALAYAEDMPGHLGEPWARAQLAEALLAQGRVAEALAVCPEGEIEVTSQFSTMLLIARGRSRFANNDVERASGDFERAFRWCEAKLLGEGSDEVRLLEDLLATRLRRDPEDATVPAAAEQNLEVARAQDVPGRVAAALKIKARVTADPAVRAALLEEALARLAESPRRLLRAEVLVDLGAALRLAGRRADARDPLREGMDLAQRCGANGLAARAQKEILASGGRRRRAQLSGVASLTPSERRVVELAAAGRTNRAVASELYVTVKTVEMHLRNAFRKLGVQSRKELAGVLSDD